MSIQPPRPGMPQLNALRAFEAAARLNSISAAAGELCVTPSAVAQQVKALEAWTGKKLFKRHARGVELTPLGAGVLNEFTAAFDQMGMAVQKLRLIASPLEVRIAALPSVAQLWLSPRLPKIRQAMPDVSISVSALETPPNLVREPYDFSIFYLDPKQVNDGIEIARDVIYPVCSPSVARRINRIGDLDGEAFLHDSAWKDDWKTWLAHADPVSGFSRPGPEYSLYALAVEECRNGAGVLMGHDALVRKLVESNELAEPFEVRAELPRSLVLMSNPHIKRGPVMEQVETMLLEN